MLTLRQLFDDALGLLGYADPNSSPDTARAFVLAGIQSALQLVQTGGPDFCSREPVTVPMVAAQAAYELDGDVQSVAGPVRLAGGLPLRELTSRAAFDQFAPIYLGQASVADGTPLAFFVEGLRAEGDDSAAVKLHVVPAPAEDTPDLLVDVIKEPPSYELSNLCDGSVPPVPHQYHESILQPLVRWEMRCSRYFQRPEMVPDLRSAYNRALRLLGLADTRAWRRGEPDGGELREQEARAA